MLGIRTQLRLADLINAIADTETAVEMTRQVLAEKKGFEPHAAFKHLDRSDHKRLSVADLADFLTELDLYPTEEEIRNLILDYSPNDDPRLSYEVFEKIVLPATNPYLRQVVLARVSHKPQGISYTSAWALARVLDKEIVGNRKVEILRQSLLELEDWDITEAFLTIDNEGKGFLTATSVLEFLRYNEVSASYEDALSFMRRVDKDEDGKVSYREFVKAIHLVSKIQDKPHGTSSKKKISSKYVPSPSPKRSESVQRPSSSKTPTSIHKTPASIRKTPVKNSTPKNNTPKSGLKYKAFTPKKQLSDQDYSKYLNNHIKTDYSERLNASKRNNQEISPSLWPAESNSELIKKSSYYKNITPQKGKVESSTRSKKSKQKQQQQKTKRNYTPLKDNYLAKRDGYILPQPSFTPKQEKASPKQCYTPLKEVPTRVHERSASQTVSASRKENDIIMFRKDTPMKSGVNKTEQTSNSHEVYQKDRVEDYGKERIEVYREDRDISPKPRYTDYSGYKAKRSTISKQNVQKETEENYDFTGYRATLGRISPRLESQELKNNREDSQSKKEQTISFDEKDAAWKGPSYNTPMKEKQEDLAESWQKKTPAEFIISPRKERSPPGRYLGAKTLGQKTSIKGYEEQFLIRSIKTIIEYERELQASKMELALQKDFSTISAFRKFINEDVQDTTDQKKFEENLKIFGIFFTKTESEAVFSKFDNNGDGIISLKDFERLIVPTSKDHAGKLRERDAKEELGEKSVKLFISFVKKFATIESQLEDLRVRISKRFSLEDAFKAIDTREKGFIDSEELKEILVYHGVFPTEKDLKNVINKIGTKNDGKLSIQEFTRSFSPQRSTREDTENGSGAQNKKKEVDSKSQTANQSRNLQNAETERSTNESKREAEKIPPKAEAEEDKLRPEAESKQEGPKSEPFIQENMTQIVQERENTNEKSREDQKDDSEAKSGPKQVQESTDESKPIDQPETEATN